MGGAVSSGRDNNELIDNLMGGNYIRTRPVERVFRALDRADYMTPEARDQAYKDLAWRNGPLHMSAPCIYSEVLEGLELKPGLSFLNIGSGTGYFSTLVGLIIGSGGINHGVEVHPLVLDYSVKKLGQFIENSPTLDEFDFCQPKFYGGNGLCLAPLQAPYDRVYCGAGCPEQYHNYFKQLIKVGGILVMPLNDNLVQIKRTCVDGWSSRNLLNVSFATLRVPTKEEAADLLKLEEQCPPRLQILARAVVRQGMRDSLLSKHPHLREPPPRRTRPINSCPRRIYIPIEEDSDVEGLNALHDLDHVNGANEMNALLSLVLSMGQNRVAGALRFDSLDSPSSSSSEEEDGGEGNGDDDGDDGDDGPERPGRPERPERPSSERGERPDRSDQSDRQDRRSSSEPPTRDDSRPELFSDFSSPVRSHRGLITFEFQDEFKDAGTSRRAFPSTTRNTTNDAKTNTAKDRMDTEETKIIDSSTNTDNITLNENTDTETKGTDDSTNTSTRPPTDRINRRPNGVPAEVEIYLGKEGAASTSSFMDWTETRKLKTGSSSEEDTTETSKEKRKKLDSGIGEGSSGSSPVKTESNEGEEDTDAEVGPSDNVSDGDNIGGRRRRQKRGRCALGPRSASSSSGSGSSGAEGAGRRKRRAAEGWRAEGWRAEDERARPRRGGSDARRVRLSVLMKRGVKQLPLPYALKKYVNLGRCFEF